MATRTKVKKKAAAEREPVKPGDVPASLDMLLDRYYMEAALCVSRRTFTKMIAAGEFPAPDTHLLGTMPRWRVSTFNAWCAEQKAERHKDWIAPAYRKKPGGTD